MSAGNPSRFTLAAAERNRGSPRTAGQGGIGRSVRSDKFLLARPLAHGRTRVGIFLAFVGPLKSGRLVQTRDPALQRNIPPQVLDKDSHSSGRAPPAEVQAGSGVPLGLADL